MASYLSVVTVLLDKDANRVVAQMAPSDAGLMVVLVSYPWILEPVPVAFSATGNRGSWSSVQ